MVRLTNPLAEDAPYLYTSVLDSLIDVARRNVSRGLIDVAIFEVGSVTHPAGTVPAPIPGTAGRPGQSKEVAFGVGIPAQPTHIGTVMTGEHERSGVLGAGRPRDWAGAVEVVRIMAVALRVTIGIYAPKYPYAPWHPGRTAEIRLPGRRRDREIEPGRLIARADGLCPWVIRVLGFLERACAVEIDFDPLLETARDAETFQVKPVSTFPAVKKDIVLVVDETTTTVEVEALVRQAVGNPAEEIRLLGVFRGPQLDEGKKSLAFSLVPRTPDRTLTAEETASVRRRVVKRAARLPGTELRD